MNKALEILNFYHTHGEDIMFVPFKKYYVMEAISELEETMKPKTCDGCKFLNGVICKHDRGLYCLRQFEADYFKPKDNA